MKHLFKLREGTMPRYSLRGGPTFALPDKPFEEPQFHFVDADATVDGQRSETNVVAHLKKQDHLEHFPPSRLEDILGGTAEEAVAAIEAGESDDILDALLFAEREHDDRVTVADAIAARSDEITTQERQRQESVDPDDIVTA